jgi:phage gpG-like protein
MTGRRGNIYLNVDTGNLRRSWFSRTTIGTDGITTRAFTNVRYAAVHQYGAKFTTPSGRQVRIPKRLFITEEFERQMPVRYEKAVLKTMLGAFNG